jgi:NADPH:quinone reductase-like Zn-dependent oxidoreductase
VATDDQAAEPSLLLQQANTVPQILGRAQISLTNTPALALLANGHIDMNTVRILPLEQAAEAHRLIEAGSTTGKLLLQAEGLMRGG